MSRVGNNPITIPEGVKVNVDGRTIGVSGKNGTHTHLLFLLIGFVAVILTTSPTFGETSETWERNFLCFLILFL